MYFFVFAGKFSIDPTDTSITSRVAPALTMILIVLLVLTAIMSVASVIVSYAVHEDEEAFVDDWNSNDPSRDAETNLSMTQCHNRAGNGQLDDSRGLFDPDEHEPEFCNLQ